MAVAGCQAGHGLDTCCCQIPGRRILCQSGSTGHQVGISNIQCGGGWQDLATNTGQSCSLTNGWHFQHNMNAGQVPIFRTGRWHWSAWSLSLSWLWSLILQRRHQNVCAQISLFKVALNHCSSALISCFMCTDINCLRAVMSLVRRQWCHWFMCTDVMGTCAVTSLVHVYCCHWIRGQYWEAIGPMELAVGSWKCPPPGTCTGTDTPGDIKPGVTQSSQSKSHLIII